MWEPAGSIAAEGQVLAYIRQYAGLRFDPRIAALCERPDLRRILLGLRESDARPATERRIA